MKFKVSTKKLSIISVLSAVGAALRIGLGWAAYSVPYVPLPLGFSLYSILMKIGLTETLAFVSGFAFGPAQGFFTGVLIIAVSDTLSVYGPGLWTPFIAAIMGLLGIFGGLFRRFKENPTAMFLGVSAASLTVMSELLQNIWFAWYMWSFYMPETPFLIVLLTSLVGGTASIVTALINNTIFFMAISPRIIKVLKEQTALKPG